MSTSDPEGQDARRRYLDMSDVPDETPLPPAPEQQITPPARTSRTPVVAAAVACVVGVVAVAGIVRVVNRHDTHPAAAVSSATTVSAGTATPSTLSTASSSTGLGPTGTGATSHVSAAPTAGQSAAVSAATHFVRVLLDTKGKSRAQWNAATGALCTSDFATHLALTDPADIPAQTVKGGAKVTDAAKQEQAVTVFVPTSKVGYTVLMLPNPDGAGWQVQQASMGAPAGPTSTDRE